MEQNRGNFGSRLASILVAAGSAVGLGNIWRFPYELGRNGGSAFLIIYIMCVVFFGVPLMISEFAVGRHAQSNTARAFGMMAVGRLSRGAYRLTYTLLLCRGGRMDGRVSLPCRR